MATLTIAFCDDDPIMRSHIRETVTRLFQDGGVDVVAMEFDGPQQMASAMAHLTFGLLFLDIDMPGTDGVKLGEQLRTMGNGADIIFVSNLAERVYEVFSIHPWSFIRKSTFDEEIPGVVRDYIAAMHSSVSEVILHDVDGKTLLIRPDDIVYVESAGKLQKLFTPHADEPLMVRCSLHDLEQTLTPMGFIRIHKGFLVNYRYVQKITSRGVILDSGQTLPVGRDRLQETRERYLCLMKWKAHP